MMQKTFIVNHLDVRLGPLTKEEVLAKVESKEIFPTDYVFVEDKNDWVMIFEFFEDEFTVAPVPTPPVDQSSQTKKKNVSYEVKDETKNTAKTKIKSDLPPILSNAPTKAASQISSDDQVPQFERKARSIALVPSVAAETPPQPPLTKESFKTKNKISFKNGVAQFNMAIERRTMLEFQLNHNAFDLKLIEPLRLHVNSGPAEKIVFRTQSHLIAGEDAVIEAFAIDQFGNIDLYFSDDLICVSPQLKESIKVAVKDGRGSFKLNLTIAGEHEFNFTCRSQLKTKMEPLKVIVKGAPAVQIIAIPPEFIRAGEKTEITFKAVDRYGNIDHTFDNSLEIEIKSSSEVISSPDSSSEISKKLTDKRSSGSTNS